MIRRPPRSPRTDILCPATALCRSTQRKSTLNRAEIGNARRKLDPQPYENPYNPLSPLSSYALAAARHMHQYGPTREQLAEVAVAARKWAQLNPEAFMRAPLSIETVLASRSEERRVGNEGVRTCKSRCPPYH